MSDRPRPGGGQHLAAPVVGIEATDEGYWLLAADGGIFTFGAEQFEGRPTVA